ncbi:MAG: hypothetical protein H7Z14_08085, partial [Anaerolineae bacterium]|nr:hypothetical protein [Phycisphaerae bacterium]
MQRFHRTRSIFVAAVAGCAASALGAGDIPYHKGLDLALFSQTVDPSRLNFFLDNAAAMGVDHLSINHWWFQDNINSTQIAPNFSKYSASDDTIRQVIDAAHARGMAVQLRPIVDLANDPSHWRGEITGGSSWFNNAGGYGDYIRHMADIAQAKNVELFSMGVELETVQTQETNWRNLVTDVRSRFDGDLVYGANWGNPAVGNTVNWWDAVDYVGIDAYYPLTGVNNPTPAQLLSAWTARANQIEAWRNSVAPTKQILFTEVGYQALDGANAAPYGATSSTVDMREQADCYRALLIALSGRSWFSGAYWWAWDPNNVHPAAGDYENFGKPAYDVMGSFYVPGYTIGGNWTGAGGANFSAANSWSNGTVPGNLTAVTFNSSGGGNTNINLGGAINLARLTFDTSSTAAHTFQAGGTITLNSGGGITITNTVITTQTFNNAFALSGPTIFANWSATNLQRLTINGPITSATTTRNQLALFGNGSGQLNGAITDGVGTIALFKAGDGTWAVSGNNTFSGATYIGS